jgi:phosphonate transport system substrate-binding protein
MSSPLQPHAAPKKGGSLVVPLLLVLLLVGGAAGYYWYERTKNQTPPVDEFAGLKTFFTRLGKDQTLAEGYTDSNKDLVADTPTDPAKLLTVTEIGFTAVGTDDPERLKSEQEQWQGLMTALSAAAGKPVKYLADVPSPEAQMDALKDGRLHVTAFNTGAVPTAVNTAGLVPLFVPADADGKFGIQMLMLVRADSSVQKPDDLRGKSVGFVALSSNSGAKAPMVVLKEKFNMLPGRDYRFKVIGSHEAAMAALVSGTEFDAVCVASDLKERAVAEGLPVLGQKEKVPFPADKVRVIYTSDTFPPLCFGVPHNLPTDVRAAIEKGFKEYQFAKPVPGRARFAAVSYEKDWKYVREIDATLSRFADIP